MRACGEVLGKAKLDSAAINPAPLSAARPIVFRKLDPIDTFNNDPHTTLDDVKLGPDVFGSVAAISLPVAPARRRLLRLHRLYRSAPLLRRLMDETNRPIARALTHLWGTT